MSQSENFLRKTFEEALGLPSDAADYLCDIWGVIQFFDDVKDGDNPDTLEKSLWAVLVKIPQNPFYVRNSYQLSSCSGLQILKWNAANTVEADGMHSEKSFSWRAGYYDLVLLVVQICHGAESVFGKEAEILSLYGESFENYELEF